MYSAAAVELWMDLDCQERTPQYECPERLERINLEGKNQEKILLWRLLGFSSLERVLQAENQQVFWMLLHCLVSLVYPGYRDMPDQEETSH